MTTGCRHYTYAKHRCVTGQEEFLCHGFPADRMCFTGVSDADIIQQAALTIPVPVVDAALFAMLLTTNLGKDRRLLGSSMVPLPDIPKVHDAISIERFPASAKVAQVGEDRARALLNMINLSLIHI